MKRNLISAALGALALSAAAATAVAQVGVGVGANVDVNAKPKANASANTSVSADTERRGNEIRSEQRELRKKTMATQKRINEEARLHSLHSRTDVDVSGSASTSTEGSAISR
jgi:TolA-binding protein